MNNKTNRKYQKLSHFYNIAENLPSVSIPLTSGNKIFLKCAKKSFLAYWSESLHTEMCIRASVLASVETYLSLPWPWEDALISQSLIKHTMNILIKLRVQVFSGHLCKKKHFTLELLLCLKDKSSATLGKLQNAAYHNSTDFCTQTWKIIRASSWENLFPWIFHHLWTSSVWQDPLICPLWKD